MKEREGERERERVRGVFDIMHMNAKEKAKHT
jgi:hypothetical protein